MLESYAIRVTTILTERLRLSEDGAELVQDIMLGNLPLYEEVFADFAMEYEETLRILHFLLKQMAPTIQMTYRGVTWGIIQDEAFNRLLPTLPKPLQKIFSDFYVVVVEQIKKQLVMGFDMTYEEVTKARIDGAEIIHTFEELEENGGRNLIPGVDLPVPGQEGDLPF